MEDSEMFCKISGERVRELRRNLKLSMQDLAKKVDMTKQGISRIENGEPGKTQIRRSNLKPLAIALRCTELYLTEETDKVRGTGIISEFNKKELVSPVIKYDYVDGLTSRVRELGSANAELLSLFLELIVKMKPEEQQWLKEFLKTLPSYDRYKRARKSSTAEYIIAEMHEGSFTKNIYEKIYRIIDEDEIRRIKKMRLTKPEFVNKMQMDFGNEILQYTDQEMEAILCKAFNKMNAIKYIRKGPFSKVKNVKM